MVSVCVCVSQCMQEDVRLDRNAGEVVKSGMSTRAGQVCVC